MSEFVKRMDQTGVPVTFNLKGEGVHKTVVGGFCSMIVIFLTLLIMVSEQTTVFFKNNFATKVEEEYIQESTDSLQHTGEYTVPSEDLISAVLIIHMNRAVDNIFDYFVP